MYAPTKADAEKSIGAFVAEFEAKYPKATACLVEDQGALLAFFAFPAEHWRHLRTSNLIESPFATAGDGAAMVASAERGAPAASGAPRSDVR